MRPHLALTCLIAAAIAGCSSPDEPPYQPCVPGEASACTCPDGSPGHQSCDVFQAQSGTEDMFLAELAAPSHGEPPGCTGDLSNIGAGDFHVTFDFATSQASAQIGIVNQRDTCSIAKFWDVHVGDGGVIEAETDDGTPTNYTALLGARVVNDGATHHVEVARISGTLSLTIDGVADGTAASPASFDALAPLSIRSDVCDGVNGSVPLVGPLTGLCVTSP